MAVTPLTSQAAVVTGRALRHPHLAHVEHRPSMIAGILDKVKGHTDSHNGCLRRSSSVR
jgi:hypothetical protein